MTIQEAVRDLLNDDPSSPFSGRVAECLDSHELLPSSDVHSFGRELSISLKGILSTRWITRDC